MITLTIATLISAIKRHLSIIGKRLYSKDGKNQFSDITLSSAEDTQILTQYIESSYNDVEALLNQFIFPGNSTPESGKIKFDITNTRGDSNFETRSKDMIEAYIVLNSVGEYLSMMHPDIAQKYQRDARQKVEALIGYVFHKNPPTV